MAISLTSRDVEILQALWTARYLTAVQLQALFWRESRGGQFGQTKACQRRLRQLTEHDLVRRIEQPVKRGEGPRPYIYALNKGGAELLVAELGIASDEVDWKPREAESNYPFLEHLLATNDFRIALTLACERQGFTLETWLDEKMLKSEEMRDYVLLAGMAGAQQQVAVIPDGFFVLQADNRRARCCVEVDRGMVTVTPTAAWQRGWTQKVRAYLEYQASGAYEKRYGSKNLWVLTVTTSERRLQHMKQATEEVGGDFRFWFATFDQISPETILTEKIWYQAGSNILHCLLE